MGLTTYDTKDSDTSYPRIEPLRPRGGTDALCSPTRAALLSGRNHHAVGMGSITETATSAPGYSGVRPNIMAPLAETLKLNGYATAQFGKCHQVPVTGDNGASAEGSLQGTLNNFLGMAHRWPTTTRPATTPSPGRSTGSASTWGPTATTISSTPGSCSTSP